MGQHRKDAAFFWLVTMPVTPGRANLKTEDADVGNVTADTGLT